MTSTRCLCGGGRAHHQNDIACWCPRCLQLPAEQRCATYAPRRPVRLPAPPPPPDPAAGPEPLGTHERIQVQPHRPSREAVARQVAAAGNEGATCTELSTLLGLAPKVVTAELASLQDDNEITLAPYRRTLGSASEDVWLPLSDLDAPRPHQSPLWA